MARFFMSGMRTMKTYLTTRPQRDLRGKLHYSHFKLEKDLF